MKLGVVYPQNETHGDPRGVHDIGLAVESLGYDSILFYDHVVGAAQAVGAPVALVDPAGRRAVPAAPAAARDQRRRPGRHRRSCLQDGPRTHRLFR